MTTSPAARYGTLGIGTDGTFRIQFDRTLPHPLAKVWAALTDPAVFSTWMEGCRIDPRVGGEVYYDFGDEGAATGRVLVVRGADDADPTAEIEHTWNWEGVPESIVTWRLEPVASSTRLVLTHREVEPEPAAEFAVGWHLILDVLERHTADQAWDDVWDAYDSIAEHYLHP